LLSVLQEPEHDPSFYRWTAECLNAVLTPERIPDAIAALHPLTPQHTQPHTPQSSAAYGILWNIAQQLPYEGFKACLKT
jgi:hypothetical protein